MKKKQLTAIAVLSASLVLLGATGALAYWTASGSGTAHATTATPTGALVVEQGSVIQNVDPGRPAQTVHGLVTNDDTVSLLVRSIAVSLTVTKAPDAPAGECSASDYTLNETAVTVNSKVRRGESANWTGLTIAFNDTVATQDACKGATVTLHYSVQ